MNPSQNLRRLLGMEYMSSARKIKGAGNQKNSERRHHVIEDAPSRIAPTSSEGNIIGIKLD